MDAVSRAGSPAIGGVLPQPRTHFMTLDGLRGVAAFVVVAFHRRAWIGEGALPFGYLAVDFFFVLSGFVIACAYSRRLNDGRLSFPAFVRLRAERLGPLVALGATIGVVVQAWPAFATGDHLGGWKFVAAWLPSCLLLPVPWLNGPFQVNIPAWSLFFEVIGNLLFARYFVRLDLRRLVLATCILAVILCVNMFTIEDKGGGFNLVYLYFGTVRMSVPFLIGVVLFAFWQKDWLPRVSVPFWVLAGMVVLATAGVPAMPELYAASYRLLCTFVIFPAIVVAGVQREPEGRWFPFARLSAELSYPVYILHLPLLIGLAALHGEHPAQSGLLLVVEMAAVAAVALAASRFFDIPVRKLFARNRLGAEVRLPA